MRCCPAASDMIAMPPKTNGVMNDFFLMNFCALPFVLLLESSDPSVNTIKSCTAVNCIRSIRSMYKHSMIQYSAILPLMHKVNKWMNQIIFYPSVLHSVHASIFDFQICSLMLHNRKNTETHPLCLEKGAPNMH